MNGSMALCKVNGDPAVGEIEYLEVALRSVKCRVRLPRGHDPCHTALAGCLNEVELNRQLPPGLARADALRSVNAPDQMIHSALTRRSGGAAADIPRLSARRIGQGHKSPRPSVGVRECAVEVSTHWVSKQPGIALLL